MNLYELVRLSFLDRRRFFDFVSSEPLSHVVAYLGILYLWYAVISTPFFIMRRFVFGLSYIPMRDYLSLLPVSYALVFVFWAFGLFVWSAVLHAFVSMWGGSGRYLSTLRAVVYGFTPLFVVGPVLFYGLFLGSWVYGPIVLLYLYTLYFVVKGIQQLHGLNFGVALASYSIPFITVCVWVVYSLWRHGAFRILGV